MTKAPLKRVWAVNLAATSFHNWKPQVKAPPYAPKVSLCDPEHSCCLLPSLRHPRISLENQARQNANVACVQPRRAWCEEANLPNCRMVGGRALATICFNQRRGTGIPGNSGSTRQIYNGISTRQAVCNQQHTLKRTDKKRVCQSEAKPTASKVAHLAFNPEIVSGSISEIPANSAQASKIVYRTPRTLAICRYSPEIQIKLQSGSAPLQSGPARKGIKA